MPADVGMVAACLSGRTAHYAGERLGCSAQGNALGDDVAEPVLLCAGTNDAVLATTRATPSRGVDPISGAWLYRGGHLARFARSWTHRPHRLAQALSFRHEYRPGSRPSLSSSRRDYQLSAVLPSCSNINVFHAREPFSWVLLFSLNGCAFAKLAWCLAVAMRVPVLAFNERLTGVFAGRSM